LFEFFKKQIAAGFDKKNLKFVIAETTDVRETVCEVISNEKGLF
jgi:hypothetical protein